MNRFVTALCLSFAVYSLALGADESTVRVMSFNIRYGTANDGENHWNRRKDFLIESIRAFDPDLLGTQETLGFQRDYLAQQMPEYDTLGVGRDDGRDSGEMMALYYKRVRFEKLDGGHFWLSETPDKPGSKSWDSALPRMVTWVKLRDRKNNGLQPFLFFNTHFDHLGSEARLESARLLRRQLQKIGGGLPVIVTGDFNAGEATSPYKALFDTLEGQKSPVIDTYRLVHKERQTGEGTFSRFLVTPSNGPRIDWIAASPHWEVLAAEIYRSSRNGRTPSDHFPVTAVLRPK